MAKRKQIIKFLNWSHKQFKDEYSEHEQRQLSDFDKGILYGITLARIMIENKRDKEHDF